MKDIVKAWFLVAEICFTVWCFLSHQHPAICYASLALDFVSALLFLHFTASQ